LLFVSAPSLLLPLVSLLPARWRAVAAMKPPATTVMAGAKKIQQSTKSSGGNSDGNGNNDSNDNNDENEGNGVVDGSVVLAVAAGRRRQKRGGGRQRNQYIPNWNCLLFN
jgi:hypothetical protein